MGTKIIRGADRPSRRSTGRAAPIESSMRADHLQTGTFAAGIARYGNASIDWVVGGDEIMFVLDGTLHITVDGQTDVLQAGHSGPDLRLPDACASLLCHCRVLRRGGVNVPASNALRSKGMSDAAKP